MVRTVPVPQRKHEFGMIHGVICSFPGSMSIHVGMQHLPLIYHIQGETIGQKLVPLELEGSVLIVTVPSCALHDQ